VATEQQLFQHAREMRANPSEWEKRLWRSLSNSQLGHKFRRQAVIEPFICDFFCSAKGLIVEVDGDTHDPVADQRRDEMLAARGFAALGFSNAEVATNVEGVLGVISATLATRPDRWANGPHPNPSPEGEGLRLP
jgi:very-short-patch-repair endonuclease